MYAVILSVISIATETPDLQSVCSFENNDTETAPVGGMIFTIEYNNSCVLRGCHLIENEPRNTKDVSVFNHPGIASIALNFTEEGYNTLNCSLCLNETICTTSTIQIQVTRK